MSKAPRSKTAEAAAPQQPQLVVITGLSGSGKGTVLKAFEDLGYYSVDNLPIELLPKFAELIEEARTISRAALVVDVREGQSLRKFPAIFREIRERIPSQLIYLDANDDTLVRRYSETRRPHPLGTHETVDSSIRDERSQLAPISKLADLHIETSKFNVHELRDAIKSRFSPTKAKNAELMINVVSFGFRNGVPHDSDLVFDVRFLPNPNYIPRFKHKTGKDAAVAKYVRSFPQTIEFMERITDLLVYLLPHYIREGKSYLTISFGCTGGQHRSVMMAAEVCARLAAAGYRVKETHRDTRH